MTAVTRMIRQWSESKPGLPIQHDLRPCFCVGPQNGDPACPCAMRNRPSPAKDWLDGYEAGRRAAKAEKPSP